MSLAFSDHVVETAADFEHAIAQIPTSRLQNATGIVLRVHARLWEELVAKGYDHLAFEARLSAICKRAPNIDIYALPDGHSAAESRLSVGNLQGPRHLINGRTQAYVFHQSSPVSHEAIRELELTNIFESGRARSVICASDNHHFALPSGAHASQFLRLGDAFTDIETVDRVAYWIAIEIQSKVKLMVENERYTLLVDHPSMLILAARVQLLVSQLIEIVAFPTYPSDVESRTASFDLMKQVAARCSSVFVVIGVASTGRLAEFIQNWATLESSKVEVNVFILYSLQKLALAQTVLCHLDLNGYKHYASNADCELCLAQSAAVQIQTSSYLLGYAPNAPVVLYGSYFSEQRSFLQEWGCHEGVLRVHYNDPNEPTARHHAFYIDVGTLLNVPSFETKVLARANSFQPKPDVIVVPDHPTARKIGQLVASSLTVQLVVLDNQLLTQAEAPVCAILNTARCALIIDDLFITGSRLQNINKFLRENRAALVPDLENIHFWTLLATPASEREYKGVVDGMTKNHSWKSTVTHIQKIILPHWHNQLDCPWCLEFKTLTGIAQASGEFEGQIIDRISVLASTATGITVDPFFSAYGCNAIPNLGAESLALGQGSSPMQTLFACASGMQQLRHAASKALNADQFPAPAFLAVRNFSKNYTERLLWLGMLRSVKNNELEPDLRRFLTAIAIDDADKQGTIVRGELAIAWITGKLGAISVSEKCKKFFWDSGISWESLFAKGLVDKGPSQLGAGIQGDTTETELKKAFTKRLLISLKFSCVSVVQSVQKALNFIREKYF